MRRGIGDEDTVCVHTLLRKGGRRGHGGKGLHLELVSIGVSEGDCRSRKPNPNIVYFYISSFCS